MWSVERLIPLLHADVWAYVHVYVRGKGRSRPGNFTLLEWLICPLSNQANMIPKAFQGIGKMRPPPTLHLEVMAVPPTSLIYWPLFQGSRKGCIESWSHPYVCRKWNSSIWDYSCKSHLIHKHHHNFCQWSQLPPIHRDMIANQLYQGICSLFQFHLRLWIVRVPPFSLREVSRFRSALSILVSLEYPQLFHHYRT